MRLGTAAAALPTIAFGSVEPVFGAAETVNCEYMLACNRVFGKRGYDRRGVLCRRSMGPPAGCRVLKVWLGVWLKRRL
jgi:hypothetical protein